MELSGVRGGGAAVAEAEFVEEGGDGPGARGAAVPGDGDVGERAGAYDTLAFGVGELEVVDVAEHDSSEEAEFFVVVGVRIWDGGVGFGEFAHLEERRGLW